MGNSPKARRGNEFREKLFVIIFGTHTKAGRTFDIILLILILLSVLLVMLDSVPSYAEKYHDEFIFAEWLLTAIFTVEFALRIYVVRKPWRYIFSFYGFVDLISILPTYLGLFFLHGEVLASVRSLRLFRIFRIFKLTQFIRGRNILAASLKASWPKITVFLSFVVLMVVVIGSIMYLVEGGHPESGFTSIPQSVYWAIVTMTTVGYGDISPVTPLGKFLASAVMIIGYGIIAVPTGIVSVEFAKNSESNPYKMTCSKCKHDTHSAEALYCQNCGEKL